MHALYCLRSISQRFGEREVLSVDSLDIEPGEVYALLGANGAGKTTLMRILAFLDSPSSGDLFFRGERVLPGQGARFRAGVVWVPQFPVMFTGSLLYNIEYPMSLKGVEKRERRKRALELLDALGLEQLAKSPAQGLSGGEAQRASIARALAAGANVLLFDEPTANIDQAALADFTRLIRQLDQRGGLSILLTTHNAQLAAAVCRKQIFLVDGKPARQRLLSDGRVVWPGRLFPAAEGAVLDLPAECLRSLRASGAPVSESGLLAGLSALAAGTALRLELASGHMLEVLLEDTKSQACAATLTLGRRLELKAP